jgi:hypothetical protein
MKELGLDDLSDFFTGRSANGLGENGRDLEIVFAGDVANADRVMSVEDGLDLVEEPGVLSSKSLHAPLSLAMLVRHLRIVDKRLPRPVTPAKEVPPG